MQKNKMWGLQEACNNRGPWQKVEVTMDRKEMCDRILEQLPFQTMEIKKKNFFTVSYGQNGYVWIVKRGLLITLRNTEDGRNKGIGLFDVDSLMGVGGLLGEIRHITCYTMSKTVLKFVPVKDFLALLKRDNELCYAFMPVSYTHLKCYIFLNLCEKAGKRDTDIEM